MDKLQPVAWIDKVTGKPRMDGWIQTNYDIPLYTHPAKELNPGGEPVKNATYWKRQYNEMSALNDRLKSSPYHANEQIKYLESHPAKTLTDDEILEIAQPMFEAPRYPSTALDFARAILRKAQEK